MEKDTSININISTGTIFKTIVVVLAFFLAFYLRDIILTLLVSIVVASAIEPMISRLVSKGVPRVPSVVIIYVALFVTLIVLFLIFLPLVFDDFFRLFNTFPAYIRSINISNYISDAPAKLFDSLKNAFAESFSLDKILPGLGGLLAGGSDSVVNAAGSIFGGTFSFIFVVVFSFYLAVQEKGIEGLIRLLSPVKNENYLIDLWTRSKRKIGLWMQGQILLGVLIGVFVFLGLSILGIRNALAVAIFASIFEIIPVFGPILAAFPAVLLGLIQSPSLGLLVLGFFIVIQQFENHLIYPLVVRKMIGIPPLLAIVFLLVGFELAGLMGVILAIPAAVVIIEIVEDFEKKKRFVQPVPSK